MNTTKKCFKMFDGAAKLTMMKMSTPDMKELIETLAEEIESRGYQKEWLSANNWSTKVQELNEIENNEIKTP